MTPLIQLLCVCNLFMSGQLDLRQRRNVLFYMSLTHLRPLLTYLFTCSLTCRCFLAYFISSVVLLRLLVMLRRVELFKRLIK